MSSAVTMALRSSLEEMLESLRRRDEQPKDPPKDLPPALPVRPTSRGRLPSARRSRPVDFTVGSKMPEFPPKGLERRAARRGSKCSWDDKDGVFKSGIFVSKSTVEVEQPEESPYVNPAVELESFEGRIEEGDGSESPVVSTSFVHPPEEKLDVDNYVLKKKVKVWCQLSDGNWKLGKVKSTSGDDATILLSDGKVLEVSVENLLPANPVILDRVDDLMQLSYLNEPSVLHNLKCRYSHDMIYTKAGPILVSINPCKDVPLYGSDCMTAYKTKCMESPHVYALADTAFNGMMQGVNQSIIISGESGAGKTETAKFAMQYLAALGGGSGIEHEVLQTNYILEAFGNAKTCRNDNSSRFGKLIEIHFNPIGKICGAKIQKFLLEKSRVVQQAKGERSYHVFYQLCAGASPLLNERLNLKPAKEYDYLRQSDCLVIDGVDDAERFHRLVEALDIVEISKEEQDDAFAMLAAVLWLGNIVFSVIDNENHAEVINGEGLTNAAKLLGCKAPDFALALSTHKIQAGNDSIVQKLTLQQAIDARDALAKSIYASLFDWLVEQINKSLEVGKLRTGRSISILDIYGFESFQKNSFEQFCINYANERLQQHFNRHLFKLEQEEYTQDGIDWTNVDFVDNTDCLNLFEKKPLGLLSLLDEESTFPKATDLTFANKLKQHFNSNPCFKGDRGRAFRVRHYAGMVLYDTTGFLEKNRDPLHSDSIQLLLSCRCKLPKLFASVMLNSSQKPVNSLRQLTGVALQKQSVGAKFKGQLFKLMQQLENTTPHFIRCIKPNTKQHPGIYENDLVLQQLRCCGVLEVVRISKSGYPTRMTHQQFANRYGFLLLKNVAFKDPLSVSVTVLQQFSILPEMYQVGYTKFFFRPGQIATLEDIRKCTMRGILVVQKYYRGLQARCCFQDLKEGATTLQSFIRAEIARLQFKSLIKRLKAVIIIQKHVKQRITQKKVDDHHKVVKNAQVPKLNHLNMNRDFVRNLKDVKDYQKDQPQIHHSVPSDLQKQVQNVRASLREKEEENATLRQQLQQSEAKMKLMEMAWQKQVAELQESLAVARRSLGADDTTNRQRKLDTLPIRHYCDSEDSVASEAHTPGGTRASEGTATSLSRTPQGVLAKDSSATRGTVANLVKEFEQQKRIFDDDAGFFSVVKPGKLDPTPSTYEEFRKLKVRFTTWKRDYKSRLRETKASLQKHGNWEGDKIRKKWWGKRNPKT